MEQPLILLNKIIAARDWESFEADESYAGAILSGARPQKNNHKTFVMSLYLQNKTTTHEMFAEENSESFLSFVSLIQNLFSDLCERYQKQSQNNVYIDCSDKHTAAIKPH